MEYNNEKAQSGWNASQSTLMRIDELIRKTTYYYSVGNLDKFFFSWKNVMMNARFKFSPTERKRLSGLERRYVKEKTIGMKWAVADKYSEVILDYLHSYGMILPDKQDSIRSAY